MSTTSIPPITFVVAMDREHLQEFKTVWPTWRLRPEIMGNHLMILASDSVCPLPGGICVNPPNPAHWWLKELAFLDHPSWGLSVWPWPGIGPFESQRENMLSAFVYAPWNIQTKWFCKLDTDCVSTGSGPWIDPKWFENDPVFIASPWSYSKPSNAHQILDDWCDGVPELAKYPRLNLPFDPQSRLVKCKRIISWQYFGRTDWHQWLAGLCGHRLPFPSHDTLTWHVAERTGAFYRKVKLKEYGWAHVRPRRLKEVVRETLERQHATA